MLTLTRTHTLAERAANANFLANHDALRLAQPHLIGVVDSDATELEWLFARDGALSARDSGGAWLGGCSVPARAAIEMLRKLEVNGAVACFLAPTHAAQLRAALERMRPEQAIIALIPDETDLAAMLRCEDFSSQIRSNRLWFITGDGWEEQLAGLFDEHAGLAAPGQFIRVPATNAELVDRLIPQAQRVISAITMLRAAAMNSLRDLPWSRPARARLLVVAPTRFRLWNDVGDMLVAAAREACDACGDLSWTLFDADDPASSASLALAALARQCSAIISSNTARGDLPPIIPLDMPWITWITGTRIPAIDGAGPHDRLIVADPAALESARRAGWPDDRLHIGTWRRIFDTDSTGSGPAPIAIVADTRPLEVPESLQEYSSHGLLWEAIRHEVLKNPFVLNTDINAYLSSRIREAEIAPDGFPRPMFVNELIVSAFQQGIATLLLEARVPLRLFGAGWSDLRQFAAHASGPVESRRQLAQILRSSAALVHVWPGSRLHPIDMCGAPVLRPLTVERKRFLRLASAAPSARRARAPNSVVQPLNGQTLNHVVRK